MSNVTVLPAAHLQTIPICSEITLAEGLLCIRQWRGDSVQAINLSTLQHGFIAQAFVSGRSSRADWPYCISCHLPPRRCRSVLVREPHSVRPLRAERPGLRANERPVAAAGAAKDKPNWMCFSSISPQIVRAGRVWEQRRAARSVREIYMFYPRKSSSVVSLP